MVCAWPSSRCGHCVSQLCRAGLAAIRRHAIRPYRRRIAWAAGRLLRYAVSQCKLGLDSRVNTPLAGTDVVGRMDDFAALNLNVPVPSKHERKKKTVPKPIGNRQTSVICFQHFFFIFVQKAHNLSVLLPEPTEVGGNPVSVCLLPPQGQTGGSRCKVCPTKANCEVFFLRTE